MLHATSRQRQSEFERVFPLLLGSGDLPAAREEALCPRIATRSVQQLCQPHIKMQTMSTFCTSFLPSLGAHWRRNYTRHVVLRIHLQSLLSLGLSPPCCHSAAHDIVCLLQRIPTNRSYRSHMKWRHVGTFAAARSSRFVRFWVYDGPCLVTVTADRRHSPCL